MSCSSVFFSESEHPSSRSRLCLWAAPSPSDRGCKSASGSRLEQKLPLRSSSVTLIPFPSKLLSQHFSEQLMCRAGLCNLGSLEVVTPPSPSLQVAGGAPQAPASTTVCVRTASVATPAPVLRATRERTVLSVRHGPLLRSPVSSCHRATL